MKSLQLDSGLLHTLATWARNLHSLFSLCVRRCNDYSNWQGFRYVPLDDSPGLPKRASWCKHLYGAGAHFDGVVGTNLVLTRVSRLLRLLTKGIYLCGELLYEELIVANLDHRCKYPFSYYSITNLTNKLGEPT